MSDPRAWLNPKYSKRRQASSGKDAQQQSTTSTISPDHSRADHATHTLTKRFVYKQTLLAVPFSTTPTGFKHPDDPCNRTDKHHGGDYLAFQSTYGTHFAAYPERPAQYSKDGVPLSASRVAGKPLMAVCQPPPSGSKEWKGIRQKNCYDHHWLIGSKAGPSCSATVTTASVAFGTRSLHRQGNPQHEAEEMMQGRVRAPTPATLPSITKTKLKQESLMKTTSRLAYRPVSAKQTVTVQINAMAAAEMTKDARKKLTYS